MFGHRPDGVRLKDTDPMYTVAAHIMSKRYDAMNMATVDIPLAPIRHYLNDVRDRTGRRLSHATVIMAAYLRAAAEYPLVNRFVVNKRFYARTEFPIAMVVLKGGILDNGTISKLYLNFKDTVFDVDDTLQQFIAKTRDRTEGESAVDNFTGKILALPGLLDVGIPIFKWLDKRGLLPKKLIDVSPFHNSLVFSNLASIRTNHIYHHLYDFGTSSIFFAIGNMRDVFAEKNGEVKAERCIPMGVVMDERICSGSYFAAVTRRFTEYLADPRLLEEPPRVVNMDPNIPEKKKKRFAALYGEKA